ncbi:aminoglycoside phosphotransferase [Shewanella canadensis]|uniref:Aminoglycoside phosphotransferase n=1 Tax=Shewanella canadensis TaxID=271096 RepID=A0A431WT93_9GAMM|nr:phosphotransferase [Shewanella canadensis]RTR38761.1 aminoglycoside phosphotransferase [Shewanella canadensis]
MTITMTNQFYSLDEQQQCQFFEKLLREAICQWPVDIESLELVKHRENAVFKLMTTSGEKYAVRVHRANYHTNDELLSEIKWNKALADSGIETSSFLKTKDGRYFHVEKRDYVPEPRQIDIVKWVDGEPLGSIEAGVDLSIESLMASYTCIGEIMARCHNQASQWELPTDFTRHAWDVDGLFGKCPTWGKFWELECLNNQERILLNTVKKELSNEFNEFGQTPDRYSLIHADMLPENLLESGDSYSLIDFDDAGFGWHMFDIATSLFFHLGEEHFDDVLHALLTGYRRVRDLPDEHLAMLPSFLLARGTTYLGWAHTRKETDIAKELTPIVKAGVIELAEHYLSQHKAA